MRQPAATLEAFYQSRLGEAAARLMGARMLDLWGSCESQRVLGIGFPGPLLRFWQDDAATCVGAYAGGWVLSDIVTMGRGKPS